MISLCFSNFLWTHLNLEHHSDGDRWAWRFPAPSGLPFPSQAWSKGRAALSGGLEVTPPSVIEREGKDFAFTASQSVKVWTWMWAPSHPALRTTCGADSAGDVTCPGGRCAKWPPEAGKLRLAQGGDMLPGSGLGPDPARTLTCVAREAAQPSVPELCSGKAQPTTSEPGGPARGSARSQ